MEGSEQEASLAAGNEAVAGAAEAKSNIEYCRNKTCGSTDSKDI